VPYIFEALFYKTKAPVFIDYDDPIFHFYNNNNNAIVRFLVGDKISKIMKSASHVSVSSHYMYDYAKEKGITKLSIIPPAVDFNRYKSVKKYEHNICTIGWIGSPSATKYLNTIEEALIKINLDFNVEFVLIGAGADAPKSIPFVNLDWSERSEEQDMSRFDIGIMPLSDDFSSIARDHYKLVKYMASSIPYVASPVKESKLVTQNGKNGFIANNIEDWVQYLSYLINNYDQRKIMGENGFLIAKQNFSVEVVNKEIVRVLKRLID
jgi:glycosyltransferase involved in cell wall biosynthesis